MRSFPVVFLKTVRCKKAEPDRKTSQSIDDQFYVENTREKINTYQPNKVFRLHDKKILALTNRD